MPPRERRLDRATWDTTQVLGRVGRELREARVDRGLTLASIGDATGISIAELSRVERGLAPRVPLAVLTRCAAAVGLDLVVRLYPGGPPIRDIAHVQLLADFRARMHRTLRWATEVPLPIPGDKRAWDATVRGPDWTYGIEAETAPRDAQALNRRVQLKTRDGQMDGVILVMRDSRRTAAFLREAADELMPNFPVAGRRALELLGAGVDPRGSSIVIVPRRAAGSRDDGAVRPRSRPT